MVQKTFSNKNQQHNLRLFEPVYTQEQAEEIALQAKDKAFSIVQNVKSLFTKKAQVKVNHVEIQYWPFWHIIAENYMDYKRKSEYSFSVKPEVRSIKIHGKDIEIDGENPVCVLSAEDHCIEHYDKETVADASESHQKNLDRYLQFESKQISSTRALQGKNKVVIPAQVRASYFVRELFKELIKPIQADKIIEERVEVTSLILYFRPAYSVELLDESTGKTGVLEVDALTGEIKKGQLLYNQIKGVVTEDVLFDIGAELVSTIIPGAGVGAAIGKEFKKRRAKKKEQAQMARSKAAYDKRKSK